MFNNLTNILSVDFHSGACLLVYHPLATCVSFTFDLSIYVTVYLFLFYPLQQVHPALALPGHPSAAVPPPHMAASPVLASPVGTNVTTASASLSLSPLSANHASSNVPCSTLFVANLGTFCSEQELKDLFSRY